MMDHILLMGDMLMGLIESVREVEDAGFWACPATVVLKGSILDALC